ncbi:MAG: hypothetical protein ACTHWF_08445 [Brachybacterium sp.]|uniref:hypothetical protein n=1 Tax=Brachybacterium sp. Z12 TaxID=2759167 RepID=UPI001861D616|nr:hypothetical protein [Brachybacterium sp. Z12]QNN81736.1 hypothetical protein H3H54_09750 [Brachybacterium sp. Z12]
MAQRRTTRRTALAGLGALGVMTTAGACSLLPGLGGEEEPTGTAAPQDESDASEDDAEPSEEPTEEPGSTFDGWASEEDLDLVELDLAAADEEFGTAKGQLEREDRYGTWWSPGFADDSPVFTMEPQRIDERAEEAFGGREEVSTAATTVLVQTIVQILDTPLLLEEDNSRSGEIAPALVEAFGLEGVDVAVFDGLFAEMPVSGTHDHEDGLPEGYGFEPLEYPADGPRMSILDAATEVEHLEIDGLSGPLFLASVRGALPVRRDGEELPLVRDVTYGLALDEGNGTVLMVYRVNSAPSVHIEDPSSLPLVEGTEVPGDWTEHTVRGLKLALPPGMGDPDVTEVGLMFQGGDQRGSVIRTGLGTPSPYPLSATRYVARAEVPGADLAVFAIGMGLDSTYSVGVTLHREKEQFMVQLHDVSEEEAPLLAHRLLAGLGLAS